ncbi:MAG: DUF4132 domain-containing protein [Pseudomonadota bacterium]
MTGLDIDNTSLNNLHGQLTHADFARALVARWRAGEQAEVRAFILQRDTRDLYGLYHLRGDEAPWWHDFDLWRPLFGLFCQRGISLNCDRQVLRPSQAFSQEAQAIAQAFLTSADQNAKREGPGFVVSRLFGYFWYEGISREECLALIDWAQALRLQARIPLDYEYSTDWEALINSLTNNADLISLAEQGGHLCKQVLQVYKQRVEKLPVTQRWLPWHGFFEAHPELFDRYPVNDLELIAQRWATADETRQKELAVDVICLARYVSKTEWKHLESGFVRLLHAEPMLFAKVLTELGGYYLEPHIAQAIWREQYPDMVPLLLPLIADEGNRKAYRALVHELLAARPDDLLRVTPVKLGNLLPILDATTFKAILPHLATVVAGSSSKALRETLANCAKKLAPNDFAEAGWLKQKAKNLQLAYRDILLAHPDPAASPLLAELLAGGRLDAAAASTVQAHLQKLGILEPAIPGDAAVSIEASLSALEAQAAKVKRIAATVRHFEAADFLGQLQPLSEHAVRVVFHLAATAEAALPPLAEQLLAQVSAEQQARLALAVVHSWIAQDGDPKLRWALKLLPGRSDDRMVDALTAAVMAWGKTKKQRAVIAVEQLGELDSLYALARVQEITTSKKVKDMVHSAARGTLISAAARRKLSVAELCDELTPDFGLSQGLTLTVGARIYRVLLQGDLSLRVVDERGKASKSLPANKDAADQDAWEAVNSQFKTLVAALKAVLKQQGPRMEAAFMTGKTWPLERWQRLFLDHPLLRSVGRSLIWQVQGAGNSFRIAEDFSLLDVEDNGLTLPKGARIGLWHPVTAEAGEAEAWKANLADYELEPLVDQFGACSSLPEPEQFKDDHLLAPAGLAVPQGRLAGVLAKCGYRAVLGDSSIYQHEWRLPSAQLCIRLQHSTYMHFMVLDYPVTLEQFEVYDTANGWARLNPSNLPKPLLATLMGQLRLMAAKAQPVATA